MQYIVYMHDSTEIQVLPIEVANQIAAGEVVERPASVVKELLENAVDAGATRLDIVITAAGKKLISLSDNGRGMTRADAQLSVARHATSKIQTVDDIDAIRTLGFRGEALAAISSVSRFRLVTCRRGTSIGTELLVHGGQVQETNDCGAPEGTKIEVRDLFYNVPARRKFLRSNQTELAHIRDIFLTQALAVPSLAMRLVIDGKDLYRLAASNDLIDRLRDLFGPDFVSQLIPVNWSGSDIRVSGFVSKPLLHRSDRNEQYLFINGRSVSPALLRFAIHEAYQGVLPKGRFPSVFLFLELDPTQVDVNVHPTKKEIRFRRPMKVRDDVIAAISEALQKTGLGENDDIPDPKESATQISAEVPDSEKRLAIPDLSPVHTFRYPRRASAVPDLPFGGQPLDEVFAAKPERAAHPVQNIGSDDPAEEPEGRADGSAVAPESPWSWCRVMGQVGGIYVALETEAGLVLMDPRAAHERVLYECLRSRVAMQRSSSQPLLLPETLQLTPRDAELLRQHLNTFHDMGFGVSPFDGDHFIVDAVPSLFEGASGTKLIQDVLSDVASLGRKPKHTALDSHLLEAACHAAVGLRKQLTLEEIEKIVVDLAQCEIPYTSPRGRPTLILMSLGELHRKFGREGRY